MRAPIDSSLTLRFAFPDDETALRHLAALDSAAVPPAPLLVAESGDRLVAALSLSGGTVIADPFHPTVALVALLRARAAQLSAPARRPVLRGLARAFRAPWARPRAQAR
jgi:hypothetical protein